MSALRTLSAIAALLLAFTILPLRAASPAGDDIRREILVTFTDRALKRPPTGSPGSYLRRGADYDTTSWSHEVGVRLGEAHRLRAVTEWPILTLGVHCVVYAIDDERPLADVIAELKKDERVTSAQPMATFHTLSAGDPYEKLQHSLQGMNVERAHRRATGSGVTIAMVDTGVDLHHPDLLGQIAGYGDLAHPGAGQAFDNDIHGTAVAGVIAALAGNGHGIVGVAPGARLLAYRACWPQAEGDPRAVCSSLSLASALDAAIRAKPRILNMSLTGPADPLVESLVEAAVDRGIVVIVAEPPAADGSAGFVRDLEGVIRVRAAGIHAPAKEEARGSVVVAPGIDVLTTFPHGTYNFVTGSSFAAANVSGLVALLLEVRPDLRTADIERALAAGMIRDVATGQDAGIDACAALGQLGARASCDSTL
jgi:subtilisin family serine protease